jgi:chemotaxis protein histidine kinase CheA
MDEIREQIDDESPERMAARLREVFRDEAYELVSELESALLELEKIPEDAELVGRVFRALHTIKGSGAACGLTDSSAFAHAVEGVFDRIRKGEIAATENVIDLTLVAADYIRSLFDVCYRGGEADPEQGRYILASFQETLKVVDSDTAARRTEAGKNGYSSSPETSGKNADTVREKPKDAERISSIRVSTEKLDLLVNLVGELVTVQTRLSRIAFVRNFPELLGVAEDVKRLTAELRDSTMSVRMLPIGTIFGKFRRLVRDLSADLGKDIELVTEGAETELDKTVIERLNDPLIHLIRNSIDHGIEKPDARESSGKLRTGTIRLSAAHAGAHVLIRIQDDGAGLDKEAIHSQAVEKGFISQDSQLPDRELFPLVLAPGFSTAKSVTAVSGRGVGLDVVKRTIDALRGTIEIDSEQGKGTAITLKLPLTLAIIDGFLTKIGAEHYIFPLAIVEECVELTHKQAEDGHGRNLINVRSHIIPYVRLREQFHIGGEPPPIEQIVITQVDDKRVGFVVDHIVGGHQTVIKNLGTFYRDFDGVSGATILGDGTVALILDVPKLVQSAVMDERERMEHANSCG